MENALLSSTSSNLANLLDFYTDLLRKWTSELLANTSSNHEAFPSVAQLTDHTNVLILTLVTTNPSVSTTQSIMAHLRAITDLSSRAPKHLGIRIISPPSLVVYLLTFVEPTITTMSPLSGMLAAYKKAFEASLTLPETERYPQEYVNNFNGYLMDVCNLLWRGRAFNTSDTNARGCLLPAEVYSALESYTDRLQPPQSLPSLFSLSLHPSLAALSNAALRELEQEDISNAREDSEMDVEKKRHAGPVSQRSLILLARSGGLNIGWAEYRQAVLRHLADRGLEGVRDLMYCTMTVLIGSKGRGSTLPAPGQDNSQAIGVQ
jgi:centromere protein I